MKTMNTAMAVLALALCLPAAAVDPPPPAPVEQAEAPVKEGQPRAGDRAAPAAATESRLEQTRGGDATVDNQAKLSGVVSGNSAVNVTTGSNIIDTGSFANASGMPMVIQNSGANVLIQNATVINLQLR